MINNLIFLIKIVRVFKKYDILKLITNSVKFKFLFIIFSERASCILSPHPQIKITKALFLELSQGLFFWLRTLRIICIFLLETGRGRFLGILGFFSLSISLLEIFFSDLA